MNDDLWTRPIVFCDFDGTVTQIDVSGLTCADLGSNVGGFVDCLMQRGAAKVYAVEKGYGVLEYRLRKDPRVVVLEKTNARHLTADRIPEPGFREGNPGTGSGRERCNPRICTCPRLDYGDAHSGCVGARPVPLLLEELP